MVNVPVEFVFFSVFLSCYKAEALFSAKMVASFGQHTLSKMGFIIMFVKAFNVITMRVLAIKPSTGKNVPLIW